MKCWLSLWLTFVATGASSFETPLRCEGLTPSWQVVLNDDGGTMDYIGRSTVTIPQRSRAEGRDWPMALTLISEDFSRTGILILDQRNCVSGEQILPFEALLLTQRQDQPVLLTGCCRVTASDLPGQ